MSQFSKMKKWSSQKESETDRFKKEVSDKFDEIEKSLEVFFSSLYLGNEVEDELAVDLVARVNLKKIVESLIATFPFISEFRDD